MTLHPSAFDIALRLVLAVCAGAALGFNREERSQAAGLRTNVLICLAGAMATALANLLLGTVGKPDGSFVQIDVMRLPLGVLSGIGFIGAGAIMKRDDIVVGVTTAATLWFMTIVGICLGAGELGLGVCATLAALVLLWGLKQVDRALPRILHGSICVQAQPALMSQQQLREVFARDGYHVVMWAATYDGEASYEVRADLGWRGKREDSALEPRFLAELARRAGVTKAAWAPKPVG